jgi:hypothetical protein
MRSWCKLGKQQKLNRLMLYHKKLTEEYNLNLEDQGQLKQLFYDSINSEILNSRETVEYDSNSCSIIKILNLKRDKGEFYLGIDVNVKKPTIKTSIIKMKPVSLEKLSGAMKERKKIVIRTRIKPLVKKRTINSGKK